MIGKCTFIVSIILMTSPNLFVSISNFEKILKFLSRLRINLILLDPRPDLGLRPPYFDVHSAPPSSPEQRRNRYGWMNNWRLSWRRLCRRGRFNSAINRYMEDDYLDCPINIVFYLGAPAVWPEMPTGTFLGYVANLF